MTRVGFRRVRSDRRYHDRRSDEERRRLPEERPLRKVLVAGSRGWDDVAAVVAELEKLHPECVVVHGGCRGADQIAGVVAETLGLKTRVYPADWRAHGKAAGPIRNRLMLSSEHTADDPVNLCLAFCDDVENSRGTKDVIALAEAAGVEVRLVRSSRVSASG